MSKLKKRGILLVTSLMIFGGAAAHYLNGEIGAEDYCMLRLGLEQGSPAYRTWIETAMESGDVSRWERWILLQQYPGERKAPVADGTTANLHEERRLLAAMSQQAKGRN